MIKTFLVNISGKVQGVGFRFESYQQFVDLNLTGKAENLPDGSIEITVTGEENNLNQFLVWAHNGPSGAHVTKVESREIENPSEK